MKYELPPPPSIAPIRFTDRLTLRQAVPDDLEELVSFHERIQNEGEWTRILADGDHPTTCIQDFTVVEDIPSKKIVSSMCMIPQIWLYDGIPFRVARLDMVSTDPDNRNLGLIRAQFEALHQQCAAREINFTVVVGRPWIYRKFGYAQALGYSAGRDISRHGIPVFNVDTLDPVRIRPAIPDDTPFFTHLQAEARNRYLVTCCREESHWRHEFFERKTEERLLLRIMVENTSSQLVGAIMHAPGIEDNLLPVFNCELQPGVAWRRLLPSIFRYLEQTGEEYAQINASRLDGFSLRLGIEHPIYSFLTDTMQRELPESPFAWYVRIADLPGFIRLITSVIDRRLACSSMAGFDSTVGLSFYSQGAGLEMVFSNGHLVSIAQQERDWGKSAMPIEHFIQLVLGYRSVEDLEAANAEVHLRGSARELLQAIFPKQPSGVFSIC